MKTNKNFVESLKMDVQDSIRSAIDEEWEVVIKDVREGVYAEFSGYDFALLRVVDGCTGEDWWESKLSDLVTEFIDERDGSVTTEEHEWCDAIASDLEKQAKRLRKHAASLRDQDKPNAHPPANP